MNGSAASTQAIHLKEEVAVSEDPLFWEPFETQKLLNTESCMINVQDRLDTLVTFYIFKIPIKLFKNENEKWGSFAWHCFYPSLLTS